ncbi:MAG TPA: metallophosphoesterase family protein [Candidatus Kapabacteria bacterium]|nr:metallophosphoesterase family protein [Candidatus Kapabacteria bacterium]
MKLGIISDIHGNLEALETVLKKLEREKVQEIVCLGDIVGYGANPNECCELVRKHCSTVVLGNHDEWAVRLPDRGFVNRNVWESILWTAKNIEEKHRQYFSTLPLIMHSGNLIFTHSTPANPQHWDYITDRTSASKYFQYVEGKLCFVGHSHLPGIYNDHGEQDGGDAAAHARGTIVNVGSVGQPRDGNAASCFCVYDSEATPAVRLLRIPYDVEQAAHKIIHAGIPPFFASRLSKGF